MHIHLLISDWLFFILLASFMLMSILHSKTSVKTWASMLQKPSAMIAAIIMLIFISITTLDCINFSASNNSLLDKIIAPIAQAHESTYSQPLATTLAVAQSKSFNGSVKRIYEPLKYVPTGLPKFDKTWLLIKGIGTGIAIGILLCFLICYWLAKYKKIKLSAATTLIMRNKTSIALRCACITLVLISIFICCLAFLAQHYHVLGTDQIGNDVLYYSIKSIRTGVLIGTLTTGIMLPFALLLGPIAGFLRGWADDVIQYIYITLSAIPGVLLISACILTIQLYLSRHQTLFSSNAERADLRLVALCAILGITSWASLCRLLRAETLKLRGAEYIQAARCMRVSKFKIITTHILPNIMHIVIITIALDFSGLVLAEAVLSYIGVGVDPSTISWGQMINSSRLEMARTPTVWWPLASAMFWMFALVLSANILGDALRDALDPHLQKNTKAMR